MSDRNGREFANWLAIRSYEMAAAEYNRRSGENITRSQAILAERRAFRKLREALVAEYHKRSVQDH